MQRRFVIGNISSLFWGHGSRNLTGNRQKLVILIILFFLVVCRSGCNFIHSYTTISSVWNIQNLDVASNGNILLCLQCIESNTNAQPIAPAAIDLQNSTNKFIGKYIQLSGTVQSSRIYPSQGGLSTLIVGDNCEVTMLVNNGQLVIDTFLIGVSSPLTPGSSVTVYGYTPGLRYIQNSQGTVTPEVVLVGRTVPLSASF